MAGLQHEIKRRGRQARDQLAGNLRATEGIVGAPDEPNGAADPAEHLVAKVEPANAVDRRHERPHGLELVAHRVGMAKQGEICVDIGPGDPPVLERPRLAEAPEERPDASLAGRHGGGEPTDPSTPTMYGRDFSLGHFNQHARVRGEIRVGDQTWALDGRGWRDHSWGPRYWQAIYFYRLFLANFPNGDGLMLLKITDKAGHTRREGVLLVDGQYEDILDMDLVTDWTDKKDPAFARIGVRTKARKAVISGEILTLAPLRNRRRANDEILVSRIAEGYTRFRWDGQEGYGMTEYIERLEDGVLAGYPL